MAQMPAAEGARLAGRPGHRDAWSVHRRLRLLRLLGAVGVRRDLDRLRHRGAEDEVRLGGLAAERRSGDGEVARLRPAGAPGAAVGGLAGLGPGDLEDGGHGTAYDDRLGRDRLLALAG